MSELKTFSNSEFGELDVLLIDGKEYFPATSCAKMLGYSNPRDAIKRHCKTEGVVKRDGVSITVNQYGKETKQTVSINYINEGNLYRLIVHSKLPSAERFERWVFDEVLPSIRKQEGYAPDVKSIATQAATIAATEVVKQLLPVIRECMGSDRLQEVSPEQRPRKHAPGIIDRLDVELRQEVEDMLCSGRFTYSDIVEHLREQGIKLSAMAVCRYAKAMFR